jgi:hypothetical protein
MSFIRLHKSLLTCALVQSNNTINTIRDADRVSWLQPLQTLYL